MNVRPYKFLVVPVLQALDDEGNVIGERQSPQPDVVFGVNALRAYADDFDAALESIVAEKEES